MNKTVLNMEDWKATTDGGWMNTKTGETIRGPRKNTTPRKTDSLGDAHNNTDYRLIDEHTIENIYTGETLTELWDGGILDIEGELFIRRGYFTSDDGDYYTPYKTDRDDARIRQTYGAENYDDVNIYDTSMEDEKINFYDECDNITDTINISATHRKKYRKQMLKEIGKAELKKDRQTVIKTIDRWLDWASIHHDNGAYDILTLYKEETKKDSYKEMTIAMLWDCLHPYGKYYEAYAE